MIGWLPESAKFFQGLLEEDEGAVDRQRARGCPSCRGRLDRADYPRKPRGLPEQWEGLFSRRFSLCCCREGCRRRVAGPVDRDMTQNHCDRRQQAMRLCVELNLFGSETASARRPTPVRPDHP